MSHDVFGLGAAIGLLMQELDGGHLLAALSDLDAVADQHQAAVDAHRICEDSQHRLCPQNGEPAKLDGGAMKGPAQRVVVVRQQAQRAYDAGDAPQLRSHHHADHDGGEPHEGGGLARKGRAERLECIPAGIPKQKSRPSLTAHGTVQGDSGVGHLHTNQRFTIG